MKRLLAIFVIFFIIGILLCGTVLWMPREAFLITGILLAVLIILSVVFIKRPVLFYIFVCLFFFVFGVFNYLRFLPKPNDIGKLTSTVPARVLVYGRVSDNPENRTGPYKKYSIFSLKAEKIRINGHEIPVSGKIYVKNFKKNSQVYFGEKIIVSGKLMEIDVKKNEYCFDYRTYLMRKGIQAFMSVSEKDICIKAKSKNSILLDVRRYLAKIRLKGEDVIKKYCSKDAAAVIQAAVFGIRSNLGPDITDIFVKTGTMHILAISGLHLAIFSVILIWFLKIIRCSKPARFILTIIVLGLFTLLTGPKVSCMRAFLMISFVFLNSLVQREPDILTSLMLSAFIILFFQPGEIFQLGFILSYISVFALVFLTPVFDKFFNTQGNTLYEKSGYLKQFKKYNVKSISVTLAVWIAIMPIIAFNFQIITPVVVVANIFAIPLLFIVIILSFAFFLSLSSPIFIPVAKAVSGGLNLIVPFFIKILHKTSEIPFAFINTAAPDLKSIIFFYCGLIGIFIWFILKKRKNIALILILFTANFFLWQEVLHDNFGIFSCTFFDVGKADAALLEFEDGRCMLIDCGNGDGVTRNDDGRNIIAPYLRQRRIKKIDCILITHLHQDHIGGLLFLLKNFKIGTIIVNANSEKYTSENTYCSRCFETAKKNKIKCLTTEKGDRIKGFSGVDLKVLSPDKNYKYTNENDKSIVLRAETKEGNSILFCADISSEVMKNMLDSDVFLKSDIIKMPHHGKSLGDKKVVEDFMKSIECKTAIITNKAGDMDKAIRTLLKYYKINAHVTGETGAVTVMEIGERVKVQNFCVLS
ncbi:MAG: DNA internalization-related competence protein ComEC/Rec2 [Candidatus Omnitrophota bacterium]